MFRAVRSGRAETGLVSFWPDGSFPDIPFGGLVALVQYSSNMRWISDTWSVLVRASMASTRAF
jgi:hypothetical protein